MVLGRLHYLNINLMDHTEWHPGYMEVRLCLMSLTTFCRKVWTHSVFTKFSNYLSSSWLCEIDCRWHYNLDSGVVWFDYHLGWGDSDLLLSVVCFGDFVFRTCPWSQTWLWPFLLVMLTSCIPIIWAFWDLLQYSYMSLYILPQPFLCSSVQYLFQLVAALITRLWSTSVLSHVLIYCVSYFGLVIV